MYHWMQNNNAAKVIWYRYSNAQPYIIYICHHTMITIYF